MEAIRSKAHVEVGAVEVLDPKAVLKPGDGQSKLFSFSDAEIFRHLNHHNGDRM